MKLIFKLGIRYSYAKIKNIPILGGFQISIEEIKKFLLKKDIIFISDGIKAKLTKRGPVIESLH